MSVCRMRSHNAQPRKEGAMSETTIVAACCSGGDAPGMNPWLRAMVRLGLNRNGAAVLGIKDGYCGLVRTADKIASGEFDIGGLIQIIGALPGRPTLDRRGHDLLWLDHHAVSGLSRRGGAILGAGRCPAFFDRTVRHHAAELLR